MYIVITQGIATGSLFIYQVNEGADPVQTLRDSELMDDSIENLITFFFIDLHSDIEYIEAIDYEDIQHIS
jgi:hypothetical protein